MASLWRAFNCCARSTSVLLRLSRWFSRSASRSLCLSAIILKTPEMKVQLGRAALGREFDAMPGG